MKKNLVLILLICLNLNGQTRQKPVKIDVKKISFVNTKIGTTIISNPEKQILITITDNILEISNFKYLKTPEITKYKILSKKIAKDKIADLVLDYKGSKVKATYEDDGEIKSLFIRDNLGNMVGFLE